MNKKKCPFEETCENKTDDCYEETMKDTVTAKEILENKFWIVENKGARIGTLTLDEEKYILSDKEGTHFFNSEKQLKKTLGDISWGHKKFEDSISYEVHGYPTSYKPYNPMYDVRKHIPLFTKSPKSKSVYCAGHYVIRFDKGWVKSFCPKLITVEANNFKGPFKTDFEARQELSRVKSQ